MPLVFLIGKKIIEILMVTGFLGKIAYENSVSTSMQKIVSLATI